MTSSLVGSEMCIRDSRCIAPPSPTSSLPYPPHRHARHSTFGRTILRHSCCLLYTSDAADDM
eukprot:10533254-Prorocentrum_lima.AAC.1